MTTNYTPDANSDPYLEVLAKRENETGESTSKNEPSTAAIVGFCLLWAVCAGLITWGALDMGIHVVFAVLIGIVAGFIAAVIIFLMGMAGISF